MTLPTLPTQHKHKEADFGLKLKKWMKKNPMYSCSLEAKQTSTESLPFSEVTNEQLAWGMSIRSDEGIMVRVTGMTGEPDYIWCRNMPSYVVIKYLKFFCFISVPMFILEKNRSKQRSLSASRAKEIATIIV